MDGNEFKNKFGPVYSDLIEYIIEELSIRVASRILEAQQHKSSSGPATLTISEFCQSVNIGRTSVYKMISSGQIKTVKIAGRTLVPRSEVDRLTRV